MLLLLRCSLFIVRCCHFLADLFDTFIVYYYYPIFLFCLHFQRELSLELKVGRVLGLLGHNGAGKTTAIGCLTGAHNPTHGEAFIFGHSVRHEKKTVQKFMGVCPQNDILFDELTAYEHLLFWATFRSGNTQHMEENIAQTLTDINLEREAHVLASTFSGGMKRRLSVGISVMADPKLIFLDEPTTGLDPLSRRRLWDMIRRLKKGKIIVLTTHSMEEADALSDEIAILSSGKLRALGSSLFLKNRYGIGFNIALMCKESEMDTVDHMVRTRLPGAEQMANAAGYLVFSVPRRVLHLIPGFFEHVEKEAAGTPAGETPTVYEWGISNANLEEVFLRLAVKSTGLNAKLGGFDESTVDATDSMLVPQASSSNSSNVSKLEVKNVETGEILGALEAVTLFSSAGEEQKISEQMYRILAPFSEKQKKAQEPELDAQVEQLEPTLEPTPVTETKTETETVLTPPPVPPPIPPTTTTTTAEATAVIIKVPAGDQKSGTSGSLGQQFVAFYCKDVGLMTHRPKAMCCKMCCVLVFALLLVLFNLLFATSASSPNVKFEKRGNQCRFGKNIELFTDEFTEVSQTVLATTGRTLDLCNRTDFLDYVEHKCDWVPSLCSLEQQAWVKHTPNNNNNSNTTDAEQRLLQWNTTMLPALTTLLRIHPDTEGSSGSSYAFRPSLVATNSKKLLDIWLTTGKSVNLPTWNRTMLFDFETDRGDRRTNLNSTTANNDVWHYVYDRKDGFPWLGLNVTSKSTTGGATGTTIPNLLRETQNALRYSDQHGSWRQIKCSSELDMVSGRTEMDVRFNKHACSDVDLLKANSASAIRTTTNNAVMSETIKYWVSDSLFETCPAKKEYIEKFPEVAVHVDKVQGPTATNGHTIQYDFTVFAPLVPDVTESNNIFLEWMWIWYCRDTAYSMRASDGKVIAQTDTDYVEDLCEMLRPSIGSAASWNPYHWLTATKLRSRVFEKPYITMNTVMMNGLLKALDAHGDLPPRTVPIQLNVAVTSLPYISHAPTERNTLLVLINLLLTPLALMLGFPTLISQIVVSVCMSFFFTSIFSPH